MSTTKQKITPSLWFDREAEEAAKLYVSAVSDSKIGTTTRAGKAGFDVHGLSEGTAMSVEFVVGGFKFVAINGGPLFKFNPSISFLVACKTKQEVDAIWEKLSQGGTPLMGLGDYAFSGRYGWIQDRYGLSWQVMFAGDREIRQKITPTLMFVGQQWGKAEAAIQTYASVFHNSATGSILRYGEGNAPEKTVTIQHAAFTLENQQFAAMDGDREASFPFNEAISFVVQCQTQKEIDYYWQKLTADGGHESMCGWLKDKFGVSWQIVPTVLSEMLRDSSSEKVARVTNAFLKMKKFDIAELKKAYSGK